MQRIITTYIVVVVLLSLGFFGIGAIAKAAELRDPMQPPPYALQKFRQAKWAGKPATTSTKAVKPQQKPLQLTSILYARDRKVAIINDQMLVVGDRIRGAGRVLADEAGAPLLNAAGDAVISSNVDLGNIPYANLFAVDSSSSTFASLITLLSTQGNVHVLSSPRVSTVNNQKAVIKVGTDEFFVTEVSSDSTSTASGTTTTPELTLTPFFSGIALDVTPQISKDGEVILHIHPSISEVDDQTKVITLGGETFELPLALSTVRETDSVVKALNGQVVVIGGLMMNITSDEVGGVPGISDVPIVGEAFKQKRKSSRRSELAILLRPVVVDKNKVWSNYTKQSSERVRQLNIDPEGGE